MLPAAEWSPVALGAVGSLLAGLGTTVGALPVLGLRRLEGRVAAVDLSAARPAYVQLVQRLRRAGIAVSDRRAVKLQRLVAASALMAARAAGCAWS